MSKNKTHYLGNGIYPCDILNKKIQYHCYGFPVEILIHGHGEHNNGFAKFDKILVEVYTPKRSIKFIMDQPLCISDRKISEYAMDINMESFEQLLTELSRLFGSGSYRYYGQYNESVFNLIYSTQSQYHEQDKLIRYILDILISNPDQSHIQKFMDANQHFVIWETIIRHLIETDNAKYLKFINSHIRDCLIDAYTDPRFSGRLELVPYLIETAEPADPSERFKL